MDGKFGRAVIKIIKDIGLALGRKLFLTMLDMFAGKAVVFAAMVYALDG